MKKNVKLKKTRKENRKKRKSNKNGLLLKKDPEPTTKETCCFEIKFGEKKTKKEREGKQQR